MYDLARSLLRVTCLVQNNKTRIYPRLRKYCEHSSGWFGRSMFRVPVPKGISRTPPTPTSITYTKDIATAIGVQPNEVGEMVWRSGCGWDPFYPTTSREWLENWPIRIMEFLCSSRDQNLRSYYFNQSVFDSVDCFMSCFRLNSSQALVYLSQ